MPEHPDAYSRRSALAGGMTWRAIAADGRRVGRGAWLSQATEPDLFNRCRAWSTVLPAEARFGLETAAALLGAPLVREPARPQIVVPPGITPPRHPGLVAVTRDLVPSERARLTDPSDSSSFVRITSPARTWVDLAARTPDQELVAIGDHLLRTGRLTAEKLAAVLARADGARGIRRARHRAPQLDGRAMSRPESIVRVWILDSDLPDPDVQPAVEDRWGVERAHGDLGWKRWGVFLEYEGDGHRTKEKFESDIERYTNMAADDHLVLRFTSQHLRRREAVLDRCRRALLARGWRP